MRVSIARECLEQIMTLAANSADEICGLLLGEAGRILSTTPARNVAADPRRHFELDPTILIAAHRAARASGPQVIGHYHSHPVGLPMPSLTDARCASPDGQLWLIVTSSAARLWRTGPDGAVHGIFTEIPLDHL